MCFLTFFYIIGTFVGVQVSDFQENVRFCCCIVYIHTLCHFMLLRVPFSCMVFGH